MTLQHNENEKQYQIRNYRKIKKTIIFPQGKSRLFFCLETLKNWILNEEFYP